MELKVKSVGAKVREDVFEEGIHSMELKVVFDIVRVKGVFVNPFNGIERGYFELAWGHPELLHESIQWN